MNKRLKSELDYWQAWKKTATEHPEWTDVKRRTDPESLLVPLIVSFAPLPVHSYPLKILELGCGPLSAMGRRFPDGRTAEITYTDPLAKEYESLAMPTFLQPLLPVAAENLAGTFSEQSFDVVYASNCLDHGSDPLESCRQAMRALRPGGVFVLSHLYAAGLREGYDGLHQWNFGITQGKLMVSGQEGNQVSVTDWLSPNAMAHLEAPTNDGDVWIDVVFQKT